MKLLGENIRGKLQGAGLGSGFLDMTPKAQAAEAEREMRLPQTEKLRVKSWTMGCEKCCIIRPLEN